MSIKDRYDDFWNSAIGDSKYNLSLIESLLYAFVGLTSGMMKLLLLGLSSITLPIWIIPYAIIKRINK